MQQKLRVILCQTSNVCFFVQYLLGKFHSGNAYREGVHWHRKTQLGKGGQAQCYGIQDVKTQMVMALKEVHV